jgi:hypothetical protein
MCLATLQKGRFCANPAYPKAALVRPVLLAIPFTGLGQKPSKFARLLEICFPNTFDILAVTEKTLLPYLSDRNDTVP